MSHRPLRSDARLLDAYLTALEQPELTPFAIPGHKRRGHAIDEGLGRAVDNDVPLYAGLDTMRLAHGRLAEAELRAAQLWGADWCRFSTGGSTHANQAACLAVASPGDRVLVSRTLHRSTLTGLALAGLEPVWLPTHVDPVTAIPTGVVVDDVRAALAADPGLRAVLLTEPGYLGTIGELGAAIDSAHQYGVPVIVDAAWGAHLGFAPELPPQAIALGADVLVTSAHKSLPAVSQAAVMLARTERLDRRRLDIGFEATHTTSPAGSILASIDGARALLEQRGPVMLDAALDRVRRLRERLRADVEGLVLPDERHFGDGRFDPLKVVLQLAATGATGFAVERDLIAAGLPIEMADRDLLVPMVTLADDEASVQRLGDELIASLRRHRGPARPALTSVSWMVNPERVISPREAFFASAEARRAEQAVGAVSAELVAVYPPGVPVLAPGELITAEIVDALRQAQQAGARIAYAADPSLATLAVVQT